MSNDSPAPSANDSAAAKKKPWGLISAAVGGALLAMLGSAFTTTYEHKLDADQAKLETVGSAYTAYLSEIGDVEAQAKASKDSDEVDLSASKKALDAIAVYGSGDAALAANLTYRALQTATEAGDRNSPEWGDYTSAKNRYVDELRDDLGVGEMKFDPE